MKKALFILFALAWFLQPTQSTAQTCKAGTIKAKHDTICAFINNNDTSFYPLVDTLIVSGSTDSIQWQQARAGGSFTNIKGANDSVYIDSVSNFNLFRVIVHNGNLCADTSTVFSLILIPAYFAYWSAYETGSTSRCTVTFTADSNSGVLKYFWNFGDGDTSNFANPVHTYSFADSLAYVCLSEYFKSGCVSTFCKYIPESPCYEGIQNISKNRDYIIYPNLTSNIINFQSTGNTPGTTKLIDLLGRVKYEAAYKQGDKLQISTANMPKGMYLLQVTEGNNVSTQRVVIQ